MSTRPEQQVSFPGARDGSVVDLRWTVRDHHHVLEAASLVVMVRLAPSAPAPEIALEFVAHGSAGLDVERSVDRFWRHPPSWIIGMIPAQTGGDLFWRPASSQESFHAAGEFRVTLQLEGLGAPGSLMGAVVGDAGSVPTQTSVSLDLPGHRRGRPAQLCRDASAGHLCP
jgi:hypothetical protein